MPRIPPKKRECSTIKTQTPENTPFPYALTIRANLTETTLPTVTAAVRLTGIDGLIQNPEGNFNAVELIWDIEAHETAVTEEMLSANFRNYLTHPIHDPYRTNTGVRVQLDGEIPFSNTNLADQLCLSCCPPICDAQRTHRHFAGTARRN